MRYLRPPRRLIPLGITFVALVATVTASLFVQRVRTQKQKYRFRTDVAAATERIEEHLETYRSLLRSTAGLFSAAGTVRYSQFKAYVNQLGIPSNYPGIQGLGYAALVAAERVPSYEERMRQLFPAFHVWPETMSPDHIVIQFLEPLDRRNERALGFDMASEPIRRLALEQARDQGQAVATGKVTLVQEIDPLKQSGFLLYMPLYSGGAIPPTVDERRAGLRGFVYCPFRVDDLLGSIFSTDQSRPFDFEIFVGERVSPSGLMNLSSRFRPIGPSRFQITRVIDIAGQPWTIRFTSRPGHEEKPWSAEPLAILLLGLAVSFLLYRVSRFQAVARERAEGTSREIHALNLALGRQMSDLQTSENRYRTLVDQALIAIQILDPESRVVHANKAWENLWGVRIDELGDYRMLKDEQLRHKGVLPYIEKAFAGEAALLPAVPYIPELGRRKGEEVWVRGVVYPLKDKSGKLQEVVLIQEDITELKHAEDELRRSRDDLERRVEHRTSELLKAHEALVREMEERSRAEAELQQSRKLEAVGRLAGGIAHDFNNLITGILGISQELESSFALEDPRREETREVIEAATRASSLTRQLLAFGRRQVTMPRPVQLERIVNDMERIIRRSMGEDIRLAMEFPKDLPAIKADVNQVEQVILNLVLNARDAVGHGGSVTIGARRHVLQANDGSHHLDLPAGDYVVLTVTDTGQGMNAETRAHIFEPYFTTKEGGTGLGLATVYGIVKQHGGDIIVESEPGKGTTFSAYWPVATEPAREAAAHSDQPPRGAETVLVVEDEPIVRRVVTKTLRRRGYHVLEAADGAEGLELAARTPDVIDMVLTDVVMPNMNGREMVDRLRQQRPGLKVLYMSGYAEDVIVKRGILEAGIAFIEKSFTPETLARRVRDVLDEATVPPK